MTLKHAIAASVVYVLAGLILVMLFYTERADRIIGYLIFIYLYMVGVMVCISVLVTLGLRQTKRNYNWNHLHKRKYYGKGKA